MKKIFIIVLFTFGLGLFTGCGSSEVSLRELNDINNKIIEFYINNNDKAGNIGSHYVDEENKVVVVELIDNSSEEQEKFKQEVVDSKYIKFVQGGPYNTFTSDQIKIIKTKDCDIQVSSYYDFEEVEIYLVCLDEINLEVEDSIITLRDYFSKSDQTFNDSINNLINSMNLVDTYKDGGTKLYKNDSIALIKCNTIDGNKDIYIGDTNLEYQENYCK